MRWVMTALMAAMAVSAAAEYIPPSGAPCRSVPCGVGAGPAGQLAGMSGVGFDQEYMVQMFQQNADIASLAEWGYSRLSDKNLRDFAKKIYAERGNMNSVLATVYAPSGCGKLTATMDRAIALQAGLATVCGTTLDSAWVTTMIALMDQSLQAGILGQTRASTQVLRDSANNTVAVSRNEISAFKMWQNTTFLTHEQWERFCGMHPADPRCP